MQILTILILCLVTATFAEITYLLVTQNRKNPNKKRLMFVDTSVLIDGRIVPVVESGFVTDTIAIPRSVIGELQFLADNADHDKRSKARHGLDVVQQLQAIDVADVIIFQDGSKAAEGVDERLLNLAKKHGGSVCTIDFNLNKVATVEGIAVRNINDLAKNLRMIYMPGEHATIELVAKGQDSHQGVGYLEDGTMVVVEQASAQIGSKVEVEFTRSLQTAAGKMMFARKVDRSGGNKPVATGNKASVQQQQAKPAKQQTKQPSRGRASSQSAVGNNKAPRAQQPASSRNRRSRSTPEDSLLSQINNQ
ncbi:hypothetical protein KC949_02705 [Candidatus Saccharibacteria bacterium]|nr:hypothetical protein [Candidatus Saccharibacteria bacterium]